MKKELDKKLCNDFPKIFAQRNLPMTETCMCWGFACGDGWFDLVYQLCDKIQKHCDEKGDGFQVEASQVKEKFGGLRFYIDGGDDHVFDLIDNAEKESYETCERCGSKDNVSSTTTGRMSFLCGECHEKRKN